MPIVWACEDVPLSPGQDIDYPYTYQQLDLGELSSLNSAYQYQNNGRICSTLNEFGLTGFSRVLFPNDVNPCLSKPVIRVELPFSQWIIDQAKASIIANADYTEIEDPFLLRVEDTLPLYGCTICEGPDINSVPIEWKLTFAGQSKNEIPVEGTEITVYVDAAGVNRIWGNWYQIQDPGLPVIGYIEAREELVGMTLNYQTSEGQIIPQEITSEHIQEVPGLIFSPIEREDLLEVRKCWTFEITNAETGEVQWRVYQDIITGEIVKVTPI